MRGAPAAVVLGGVLIAAALAGCASSERPRVQPDPVPLATPQRSPDAALAGVVGQLQAAVAEAGSRLDIAPGDYRPSEPASFLLLPRVVLRADLADAADGFVVVYRAPEPGSAAGLAKELAEHLTSGIGRGAYPADARFSVALVGQGIVFTSFSPSRASDPSRARAVFEAVAGVGEALDVVG